MCEAITQQRSRCTRATEYEKHKTGSKTFCRQHSTKSFNQTVSKNKSNLIEQIEKQKYIPDNDLSRENIITRIFFNMKYPNVISQEIIKYDYTYHGKWLNHFDTQSHIEKIYSLPDSRIITCSNNKIKIWNNTTSFCDLELIGHTKDITTVAILSDREIISGSKDTNIIYWSLNDKLGSNRIKPKYIFEGHNDEIISIEILKDGMDRRIISGSSDGVIRIWNPQTYKCDSIITTNTKLDGLCLLSNNKLVSYSRGTISWNMVKKASENEGDIHSYNLDKNILLHGVNYIKYYPDNSKQKIIVVDTSNCIRIYNLETDLVESTLAGHLSYITSVIITSTKIVSASYDESVRIWDQKTSICNHVLTNTGIISQIVETLDNHIITSSSDGYLKQWDIETGICKLTTKAGTIGNMIQTPNGLIAISINKRLSIWG